MPDPGVWRDVRAAHLFLTRIRLPAVDGGPGHLSRAMWAFPVVGLTVGAVAAAARVAVDPLGAAFACVVAVAAGPLVTGAFHEDGLADTADALGPHDRARRLEAMRDSRLGTFGVLALCLSVAARLALLIPLGVRDGALALVAAHVLGRWTSLPLSRWGTPARVDGAAAALGTPSSRVVWTGTGVAVALAAPALWVIGAGALAALPVAAAVTVLSGVAWTRAFGGVTGDTHGASNQLVEIACYAVVAAVVSA